jgi:hypothetical protein
VAAPRLGATGLFGASHVSSFDLGGLDIVPLPDAGR